jgi:DNA-binding phage protein
MSTPHPDHELADLLDRSFGDGPAPAPPAAYLAAGRRSLRRRRGAGALAATTAVGAVALTAALVGGGSPTAATEIGPAEQPVAAPTTSSDGLVETSADPDEVETVRLRPSGKSAVELYPGGLLAKAKNVTITQRVPNPMGYTEPDHSLGIAYERNGESTWALLTYQEDPDGLGSTGGVSSDPAGKSFPTLELWLDDQVALQSGEEPPLQLVEFDPSGGDETLLPLDGVTILQQTGDVELGPGFAGPADPSAVAEVRVNGERWYVLARTLPGSSPEYIPTAASIGLRTLDDFLAEAALRFGDGGGGFR